MSVKVVVKQKQPEPEKNKAIPICYFVVKRYTQGPSKGLFIAGQLIEDRGGNPDEKILVEGVYVDGVADAIEKAIRRRAFR